MLNNIDWIELPIGVYGELNPGVAADQACLEELGLSQGLWETTVIEMIDIWTAAFAGSGIDLSFQGTNYYIAKDNRSLLNDYAASEGLGLQHAKWHPDSDDMQVACTSCWSRGTGLIDAPLRWENEVTFAIEQPDPPLQGDANRTVLNHAEEDYWNMAAFLDLKGDMYKARLTERDDLKRLTIENPHVTRMIGTLRSLVGTDKANAPYASVWMRETQADSFTWWPRCGNFDFYLYASTAQQPNAGGGKDNSCPGVAALTTDGQAVAVYNLDDTYAAGSCPNSRTYSASCDPRYRYARQTVVGQPYIYLDVDSGYVYGTGNHVMLYIDYLDAGVDQIQFQWYDGAGLRTESLAKTNSRKWKTWSLELVAANAIDQFVSGSTRWDFRISDAGDGVETIHSVKFEPLSLGVLLPTPTPVATGTATPTPVATPWPLQINAESGKWVDAMIWVRLPDSSYVSQTQYTLRASSTDGAVVSEDYPTTRSSLLVDVLFNLPTGSTVNRATLYMFPTGGSLPDGITLSLRKDVASWDNPSWNYRENLTTLWEEAGAYGATDVGDKIGEVRVTDDNLISSNPVVMDVTAAVGLLGGLSLKIEPSCSATIGMSTRGCDNYVSFAGGANQNLGIRPYLVLDLISTVGPTATPTPTLTPTPIGATPPAPTATPGGPTPTATPDPRTFREGLVINEVCTNPVTTDNVPDGVLDGDSAVELFNSSNATLDLSQYRLCVNNTCLWLEGTIQPFGYKVYYERWDGLDFVEGGENRVRLESNEELPSFSYYLGLADFINIKSQTPDYCWMTETDASPVYVERYPPTLGTGNNRSP